MSRDSITDEVDPRLNTARNDDHLEKKFSRFSLFPRLQTRRAIDPKAVKCWGKHDYWETLGSNSLALRKREVNTNAASCNGRTGNIGDLSMIDKW